MAPLAPCPPEWEDDERMSFLFSAFKQTRDVNSSDWDGKMNFWIPLILKHTQSQGHLTVTLSQLERDFMRKDSVPMGLRTVMQEMLRHGKLQKEADFVTNVSSGWLEWGMKKLIIKPIRWTIGAVLGDQIGPNEPLVVPPVTKDLAALVLQRYNSSPLRSLPLLCEEDVRSLCAEICPNPSTLNLVLLQLQGDKKICIFERLGEKLVKFVRGSCGQVAPVSESDLGIYELRKSEKLLSERLNRASEESDRLTEEARSFIRVQNKQQALRSLRKRKLIERRIAELQNKLDTVQNILERIATAETDRKDVSLEKAENLVDQIQEYCDLQDDLSQTLSGQSIGGDADLDSEDLERELNDILQNQDIVTGLPDVPTSPVITSPQKPVEWLRDQGETAEQTEFF
ncbi:hypothetical protein GDO86_006763 [Hymenochirus boettgeri]|uniref:Charged multivesicular body protein 7 n=1 Tax=Hymenochirus boettgeri TaxID=247094 RepID=A0A8T2JC85_9PIPI|nr:hypothetical protein GDO86_006763 [Hymenochirus boettgeri]